MSTPAPAALRHARLLLDTHIWLWWQADHPRLSRTARTAIAHAAEVYLSAASAWEMAIKASLGKLDAPGDIMDAAEAGGIRELPIQFRHIEALRELPDHHRDPFDRLLVAQAKTEGLTLVTADPAIPPYGIPHLWVGR